MKQYFLCSFNKYYTIKNGWRVGTQCYFSQKTGFDISCKLSPYETIYINLRKQVLTFHANCLLRTIYMKCQSLFSGKIKQEAHGPRFAHLSDIATADMQMLCNIFPILSLQLMKISSFEQFLVLKKNIWA